MKNFPRGRDLSQIEQGLFLGNLAEALDDDLLQKYNVTHILPVGNELAKLEEPHQGKYIYFPVPIDVYDANDQDLYSFFDQCYDFIEDAKTKNGAVFVHCRAGISRSATIVTAYIMKKEKKDLDEAFNKVQKGRNFVYPNDGFRRQLQLYYNTNWEVNKEHPQFKIFSQTQGKASWVKNL